MFVILTVGHIKFETKKSAQLLIKVGERINMKHT